MADNSRQSVITDANTWGEVLNESREINGMVISDMKIVIKETKGVIESLDTVLPEQDITIYLTPGKVKSGNQVFITKATLKEQATSIFNDFCEALRKDLIHLQELSSPVTGSIFNEPTKTPADLPF